MRRPAVMVVLAVLSLLGCGPVAEQSQPAPASEPTPSEVTPVPSEVSPAPSDRPAPSPPATDPGQLRSITGTLRGDAQLEGGCVWIDTSEGAIEPLLPEGHTTAIDPVTVLGPDGEVVAAEGDQVTITGRPAAEILTTCQVGAVWHVSQIAGR